ncbi:MAG TPA: purine nucleoside permease [Acidisarcina sp.]
MRRFNELVVFSLLCLAASPVISHAVAPPQSSATTIPIKVVVITMFELGADSGDAPGEFQAWVEREPLDLIMPFPAGNRDIRLNKDGVLGVVTGVGTAKAAASLMALGLDPRFDLSHAYFVVAGIAGGNPARTSLGSAVWAEWVVDGDLGYEIDGREIPAEWKTGFIPLRKSSPYELPVAADEGQVYHLDPAMVEWAYELTRDVPLVDTPVIQARRMQYPEATAQRPPFVMKGDELSSSTFWHGRLMDEWANSWVSYYTAGRGTFVTTAMEDTGTLQSLSFLAKAGRIDLHRVLVLRTISNYDQPRPGLAAADGLAEQKIGKYGAYIPSLEAAYSVGHRVVQTLVDHWDRYRDHLPTEK